MILITGATGFLGFYVVHKLVEAYGAGNLRCFVRPASDVAVLQSYGIELAYGDLGDAASLVEALKGASTLVNLASLGFGHAPGIVSACERCQVQRAVFISTTAIFTTLNAGSKGVRTEAEACIQGSGLAYTILRPTMIYGSARDRNICRLIQYLNAYPVIPVFGPGTYLQQPVFVQDVAQAVVQCLETEQTERKAYNVAGAESLTYNAVIDVICRLLNKRRLKVHIPLWLSVAGVRLAKYIPGLSRLSVEQVLRLNEDKAFEIEDARRDFGYGPVDFETGVAIQMREMGLINNLH